MILKQIFDFLLHSEEIPDSYFNQFPFKYPLQILLIVISYLLIIYKIGPQLMKNRQPYSLKYVTIIYNILQLFFNVYIFYLILPVIQSLKVACPRVDDFGDLPKKVLIKAYYYYTLLKLFDLIETVFFVLRKKDRQVSLLHVHHHLIMVIIPIFTAKYFPSVHGATLVIVNTFVHFVMYFYYLHTAWNGQNVWWKKYVTLLQIAQHYILLIHFITVFLNWNCTYPPKWLQLTAVVNNLIVIYLFTKFYIKTYINNKKKL